MSRGTSYYNGPLSVRAVANLLVCPAQAWLETRGPRLGWNRPHWSPEDPEERVPIDDALEEALGGPPERVEEQVYLESRLLRVRGVADLVAYRGGKAAVVEVKRRDSQLERARVQVSLYALILEERGVETVPVLAWPGGYTILEAPSLSRALRLVREARRILARPSPPPPGPRARCVSCNYRRVCPYAYG